MSKVRIVTDSTASFEEARFVEDFDVTIVPVTIQIGDRKYRDGIDITAEEVLQRIRHGSQRPTVIAPTVADFEAVYHDLAQTTDQICVLVHSQHFTRAYDHAQTARSGLLGRCEIAVIDTHTVSAGLGYVVEAAVHAAEANQPLDDVIRTVRGVLQCVYTVMYVSSLDYIREAGLIGETQALLGAMLEIKPLLTIEDGHLITMEKARTHVQAIEKMIEFVTEFTHIDRLCILQNTLRHTDRTRMLQDRLALEFARLQTPILLYEPLIASHIGPDGMGMVILEGTGQDDDY